MATNPVDVQSALTQIGEAARASDWRHAAQIADQALQSGAVHPGLYNTRAIWAEMEERHQDALDDYLRAVLYAPQHPMLLKAIGLSLVRVNRAAEALGYLDQAIALSPDAAAYFFKGWAHEAQANKDEARQAYERAIEFDPHHAEALGALGLMAARNGETEAARSYATRAFRLSPQDAWAILAISMVKNADGECAEAERLLRPKIDDPRASLQMKARAYAVLGDALEGQDRIAEAFAAYTAKGETLKRLHAPRFAAEQRLVDRVNTLSAHLEAMPGARWTAQNALPDPEAPLSHIFLMGFIRSGTTLLERVLLTQKNMARIEERETLRDTIPQYFSEPSGLERLADATPDMLAQARAVYWRRVRDYGVDPEGKIVLDKQPLNTMYLPLIRRMFPQAKILFAIRDPRDILLSVFKRYFEVNYITYEFLALNDIARFYGAVMRWSEVCRARMSFNLHEHRYEDMIADFDARTRAVCDFVGLEWTDAMRDFSGKAQEETIRSPSAAQVRRPLYKEGMGQWRRYEQQLVPALPILAPWLKRFGYSGA